MTADERIEQLLNRFGQTIEDLPKANDYKWSIKLDKDIKAAENCVEDWYDPDNSDEFYDMALPSYICHLADIIDRMEIALETALTQFGDDCDKCSSYEYCPGNCRDFFRLTDELLIDPELEIDDAD